MQDKKQREIHATPTNLGESASFVANQTGGGKKFNDYNGQKEGSDAKKYSRICAYCKKPGHNIEKCYKIHGFPIDFKFTKQRKFQGATQANNTFTTNNEGEQIVADSEAKLLTKENVAQLLQLLKQCKALH
ncbi:uncharacterized protein [Nicotiana tomentosiformis]|uniref:uncharacterized protein n=1 Tax=Nicotiana tomentosiformis TaxID=4098 RepID=UPI00051B4672|nr:uncharacterized protein LOC104110877 [Nicotiana tomentosiformis]